MINNRNNQQRINQIVSPLQALNQTLFGELYQPALEAAVAAEETCARLYEQLTRKTRLIADEVLTVKFPWRVRVGGVRGFQEILLPVFHPVYGVPYVPSSSIKGAVKAWARHNQQLEIDRLLGTLDNGIGCVQFLDAFPTKPCLSVDMANPNWHWDGDRCIKYKPEPHALLSMEQPEFAIGLALTSRGKNPEDVQTVKAWLEQTLAVSGIGSRVSSGYGRTALIVRRSTNDLFTKPYTFELWTAGMYGAFAPNRDDRRGQPEFRPTAVRGMLRYWFRALALGIYPPNQCKTLEAKLFGTIEPSSQVGTIRIGVEWEEEETADRDRPYFYSGMILLEAKQENHLILIQKVLELASHLGGIGRGSRRPLHWNHPYPGLRGCHWELKSEKLRLSSNVTTWTTRFLPTVRNAFLAVQPSRDIPANGNPGTPGNRNQDVLNNNAQIFLVPCERLQHPEGIDNWPRNGTTPEIRGKALILLYDNRFKGVNQQGQGNANVGGQISNNADGSTPSYVVIKSNFPENKLPYQAVTIFGANQRDRAAFANALPPNSIPVWPLPQN
ncbi:RAMP superfamily CRISPR-associated protein [Microcoleus sp. S13C4]|uniref:RAMP superfamily CRISPR-associated protein n=1 Tax=Microcoleus sp. S13C4 TaxID=3055410 RepID=UPI002FD499E2